VIDPFLFRFADSRRSLEGATIEFESSNSWILSGQLRFVAGSQVSSFSSNPVVTSLEVVSGSREANYYGEP